MKILSATKSPEIKTEIEKVSSLSEVDLHDLCEATEATLGDNSLSFSIGLDRHGINDRERLEAYWKGVLMVPERVLFIGRLDSAIASSIQLVKPGSNQQASNFSGTVDHHFVAPWARGFGLAKELLSLAEEEAKLVGLEMLRLSVRENLESATHLYENHGYRCWGHLDKYERIDGHMIGGRFYCKEIS
jgi:ribosomal protein S18 acetylase RimI-like enzyme